jgi:hypothetical protein
VWSGRLTESAVAAMRRSTALAPRAFRPAAITEANTRP